MGHRSWIVRHRPTTLLGATSRIRAHRRLGRADKETWGSSRSPRSPTTRVIILERRRPGGSIGAAFRSIILLLLSHDDDWIVGRFRSTLIPGGFGESRVRERSTAASIDRSLRSTTSAGVFEASLGKSINEFAESSVRGRLARVAGIPDEHRAYDSTSEFEARSRVLEGPGGPSINSSSCSNTPVAIGVERSPGSINELILSSTAGLPGGPSIRFVKSIRRINSRINRLEKRSPIIYRSLLAFRRLSAVQTVTRVGHVSIFPVESIKQFLVPAILETIHCSSSLSSSSIHVAVPSQAAAMTLGRETSFR